jgi:hypothetical protein
MPVVEAVGLSETSVHLLSWLKLAQEIFLLIENVRSGTDAQSASYLNGYRVSLPGVKQPEREADCSYPTTTLRTRGATTLLPLMPL